MKRHHAPVGRLLEIAEQQVAAEHIDHIVLHISPEKLRENDSHNSQSHQRTQYAPDHPQNRPLVFFCKIALDKLLKQEAVFIYLLFYIGKHATSGFGIRAAHVHTPNRPSNICTIEIAKRKN